MPLSKEMQWVFMVCFLLKIMHRKKRMYYLFYSMSIFHSLFLCRNCSFTTNNFLFINLWKRMCCPDFFACGAKPKYVKNPDLDESFLVAHTKEYRVCLTCITVTNSFPGHFNENRANISAHWLSMLRWRPVGWNAWFSLRDRLMRPWNPMWFISRSCLLSWSLPVISMQMFCLSFSFLNQLLNNQKQR